MTEPSVKRTIQAAAYVMAIMICAAPAAAEPPKCPVTTEADFGATFNQIATATKTELFGAEMRLADLVEGCSALTADGGRDALRALERVRRATPKTLGPEQQVQVLRRYLSVAEALTGQSLETAMFSSELDVTLFDLGQAAQAEQFARQALDIWEKVPDPSDSLVITGRSNLASILRELGRAREAEPLDRSNRDIEVKRGVEDLELATSLNQLAADLSILGRSTEAEPMFRGALRIREKLLSPNDPDIGESLNNLGECMRAIGGAVEAEHLHRRALAIREGAFGPDSAIVARSLNNLGKALDDLGRAHDAEPLLTRALSIDENVFGLVHWDVATTLSNLATTLADLGRLSEAEPMLMRALEIREKLLPPHHPELARSLENLAGVLRQLGRASEAEPLDRQALAIFETAYGNEHPDVATALYNLAEDFDSLGRLDDALDSQKHSLQILEAVNGSEHPLVASALAALGHTLLRLRRADEAEPVLKRALDIREKVLGSEHPDVAQALVDLSLARHALARPAVQFEPLLRRALAIRKKAFGANNLAVAQSAIYLAGALPDLGRSGEAEELLFGAMTTIAVAHSDLNAPVMAASVASQLVILKPSMNESEWPVLWAGAFQASQLVGQTSAASSLLQMTARMRISDPQTAQEARRLEDVRREHDSVDRNIMGAWAVTDVGERNARLALFQPRLASLDKEAHQLEDQLRGTAPDYAEFVAPKRLEVAEASNLLRSDEALILLDPGTSLSPGVLLVVTSDEIFGAPMGDAAAIESHVRAILRSMGAASAQRSATRQPLPEDVVQPGTISGPAQRFDLAAAYELYQMLFGYALDLLAEKHHLIFVLHGSLSALPFQLLVSKPPTANTTLRDAAWLIRDHAVSVLPSVTSLRALRETTAKRSPAPLPFIGFGDPQIGQATGAENGAEPCGRAAMIVALRNPTPAAPIVPMSEFMPDGRAIADVNWVRSQPRLPGTRCELEAIKQAEGPNSKTFVGSDATETRVKAMSASGELAQYRVLEFATHGVLPAVARGANEAGLILTPPAQGTLEDDGFLTASEVAALNLNADWVILSACDTAGGDTPGAETLSGLARGFFYAGARAMLVSHWPVDDRAAARLTTGTLKSMRDNNNLSRAEALRLSMLELLDDPDPEFANPRMWAPFSLVGDGGTIDAR